MEAVFLTTVKDAMEDLEGAILDILGAFMQAEMDEEVIMQIMGTMEDLLLEIDRELYD